MSIERRHRALLGLAITAPLAAMTSACTPAAGPGSQTLAPVELGDVPPAPALADATLPVPPTPTDWTPPMQVAGDVDALAQQLQGRPAVALMFGASMRGAMWEKRGVDLVTALSPETKVVARGGKMLDALLTERGELPMYQRVVPDGSRDVFGRPTYSVQDTTLNTQWARKDEAMLGADAIMVLTEPSLDRRTWADLRRFSVGSCEPLMTSIDEGLTASEAKLAPFVSHADSLLANAYRAELERSFRGWRQELRAFREPKQRADFGSGAAWDQYECGNKAWEYLATVESCTEPGGACPSPQLHMADGLRIGVVEPAVHIPSSCASDLGRDYPAELADAGARAVAAASGHLDPQWLDLAARAGALSALGGALESVCQPSRRRYAEQDLTAVRSMVAGVVEQLRQPSANESPGTWATEPGSFRTDDRGALKQLSRYEPGRQSNAAVAKAQLGELSRTIDQKAQCNGGFSPLPLALMLVDVGSSAVEFVGYFYEEELFCSTLPPLAGRGQQDAPVATP
ncbi:MAG: hypothetical protein AAF799_06475 [Myxococcota bacterium]